MSTATKVGVCFFGAVGLVGCDHRFREDQLVASWQLNIRVADARTTYYTNHVWVMTLTSESGDVPSSSEFGDWRLEGDRLVMITRSTLNNVATNVLDTGKIVKLDSSVLIYKVQDKQGKSHTLNFHRTDMPAAPCSDPELAQRLAGTWRFSRTNTDRQLGSLVYSTYHGDGSASWQGAIFKESQSKALPKATGMWRVEQGLLCTTITNTVSTLFPIDKESRDEILSVTGVQFTYRDDHGTIQKVLRAQ